MGKLLIGTECQILLDAGGSKSFMSKLPYMQCKSFYSMPKFESKMQRVQVGNGQFVSVLFLIPVIVDIHGHRFEIYTLVLEIQENVDLVLGIKNISWVEGVIKSRDGCFKFLDRSLPLFPKDLTVLKSKEQKLIKVNVPFIDEISGLAIVIILDGTTQYNVAKTEIHVQLNYVRHSQQWFRYHNI